MHIPSEAAEALRDKIDESGRWTASTNSDGYPKVKIEGKSHLASHVLLQLEGRPVPEGKVVLHKDNDPKNLELKNMSIGTQQQNLKQMRDEGRDRPRGVPQEPDVKTAAPAWIRETRKALQGGSLSDATAITSRMADAGTRLVKPLSMGGQEAAAGLMAGKSLAGPTATGMQVRKFYKPDSFVANREAMTDVLAKKQDVVTSARALSPQAREMVPDMHGFQELHSGDRLRHISDHEYVHGLRPMRHGETLQHGATLDREVVRPMQMSGRPVGDIPQPSWSDPRGYSGNASNLMVDAQGAPKMVDFLPHGGDSPVRLSPAGAVRTLDPNAADTAFHGGPGGKDWGDLMKEVHQPTQTFDPTLHARRDGSWGKALEVPAMPLPPTSLGGGTGTPRVHDQTPRVSDQTPRMSATPREMTVKQSAAWFEFVERLRNDLYKLADGQQDMRNWAAMVNAPSMPSGPDVPYVPEPSIAKQHSAGSRALPAARPPVPHLSQIDPDSQRYLQQITQKLPGTNPAINNTLLQLSKPQGVDMKTHLRQEAVRTGALPKLNFDAIDQWKQQRAAGQAPLVAKPAPAQAMPSVPTTSAQAAVPRPAAVAPKMPAMPAAAATHMPTVPRPRGIATALRGLHG